MSQIKDILKEQLQKAQSPRVYLELFDKLKIEKKIEEAIEIINEGIQKFPKYLPFFISLGKLYFEMKDWQKAIKIFSEVLKMDKENTIAIKLLAISYEKEKNYVEAIKKYKFLRVFFPQDEELQRKIDELEILANPPLSPKERKILKFKNILNKINKRQV